MIPINSYYIEIALIKEVFSILISYTNQNIEFIFKKRIIYIYTYNKYSSMWLIIDDRYGYINYLRQVNFIDNTYIQLSIIDIKNIMKIFFDHRVGKNKFIKIGSTYDSFIISHHSHKYENKHDNNSIIMPPSLHSYQIEDPIYGNLENYRNIIDRIAPCLLSKITYNTILYNKNELSISSGKLTVLIKLT